MGNCDTFHSRRPGRLVSWLAGAAGATLLSSCTAPASDGIPPSVAAVDVQAGAVSGSSAADGAEWTDGAPVVLDAGAPATDSGAEAATDASDEGPVHGSFGARFVERWTNADHDTDLYGLLETSIGNEKKDEVTGYVLARASWDLDGDQGQAPFGSLSDTDGGPVDTRLYEAYADFHEKGFSLLRLGRQQLADTPEWVRFDGVSGETAEDGALRQQFGLYAGRPHHEFESESSGDKVFGGWYRTRLWQGGKLRLDAMHLEDEAQLGSADNDLYSARLTQQLGRELNVQGKYTVLEEKPRDLDVRATWVRPESGWLVNVWYHELVRTQSFLAEEFDPYFATLTEYFPFRQGRVMASKSFDAGYDLTAGMDYRRLKDSADEGVFNREFERYFLTGTVSDFLVKDLALSLTGERWDGDGSDYATWGVDLTRKFSKAVRASLGSYYALFKNDFLLATDREDVRTYYLSLKYIVDARLTWSLGVDHEESSDVDNFDTLTAKATWRF
ncbi:MAG TPA: hypothetical protein VK824_10135 [Planctomycetota bacterium]|nr:hypothetical protein [Planctomycetota bacterium]